MQIILQNIIIELTKSKKVLDYSKGCSKIDLKIKKCLGIFYQIA